jgi:hypothetical protein
MLEGDLWAANLSLEVSVVRVAGLEAALVSTKKLLESVRTEGKLASEAQLKLVAHTKTDTEDLRLTMEKKDRALVELQLIPNPIPMGLVSEVAL